jgi:ribonucleotide reductase beta subunit family protein with ferritin-like domain
MRKKSHICKHQQIMKIITDHAIHLTTKTNYLQMKMKESPELSSPFFYIFSLMNFGQRILRKKSIDTISR